MTNSQNRTTHISLSEARDSLEGPEAEEKRHSIANAYAKFTGVIQLGEMQDALNGMLPETFYELQEDIKEALHNEDLPIDKKVNLFYKTHNKIVDYKPEILKISRNITGVGKKLEQEVHKRYNFLHATIQQLHADRDEGLLHKQIDNFYELLHDQGFHKTDIHKARFYSPIERHIENMWHNSDEQARKNNTDLEFLVTTTLIGPRHKKELVISTFDNQGGFPDLEIGEYTSTLPTSTKNSGIGLSSTKKDVVLNNGAFLRENYNYIGKLGAAIHLKYPVVSQGGILRQKH
jgi:hypothetical protein